MRVMIISKNLTGGGAERVATNLAGCLSEYTEVLLVVLNGQNNTYGTTTKTDLRYPYKWTKNEAGRKHIIP